MDNLNKTFIRIKVNNEGEIIVTYGLDDVKKVAQIQLADFVNEHGLKNIKCH